MKKISQLHIPYNDSVSYLRKDSKQIFNQIFVRTENTEKLCGKNIFFLIGEKGTGKTAHAGYLTNTAFTLPGANEPTFHSQYQTIEETEYEKFIELKKKHHLDLSNYSDIWKAILLFLMASKISDNEKIPNAPITNMLKLRKLKNAIEAFREKAFVSELPRAFEIVVEAKNVIGLTKDVQASHETVQKTTTSETKFISNINDLRRIFEEALSDIKLKNNHIIFIDGIDIRPTSIDYDEYINCIKGLVNAIWYLNNSFFANIRDSKGRMRVVLLVRPDIFVALNLSNQNSKIVDNSVVLNWTTTLAESRNSAIFQIADRLFSSQQEDKKVLATGEGWDLYFPFSSNDVKKQPFNYLLENSFGRPRDVVTALRLLRDIHKNKHGESSSMPFYENLLENQDFKRSYSDYLLGEIREQFLFLHDIKQYDIFLEFFNYLEGSISFSYKEFLESYDKFASYLTRNHINPPEFLLSCDKLLQYLYDLNVLCYIEKIGYGEVLTRWCYRERTLMNMSPKILIDTNYRIHPGLAKALNLGSRRNSK